MSQFLLVLAAALTVGAIVFGITVLVTGDDGLKPVEPDGVNVPLPVDRPLAEPDLSVVRFDLALRGYRMDQVDSAMRRAAYDIGYKDELIKVLQAEVDALRDGRRQDAETLRRTREAALAPVGGGYRAPAEPAEDERAEEDRTGDERPEGEAVPPADAEVGDGPIAAEAGAPADPEGASEADAGAGDTRDDETEGDETEGDQTEGDQTVRAGGDAVPGRR